MGSLQVDQIEVGRLAVFCYLITDTSSKDALLIDPAANANKIQEMIRIRGARVRWIVCTHAHPDHIGGNALMKRMTGASLVFHEAEAGSMNKVLNRIFVRLLRGQVSPGPDRTVRDGDLLMIGDRSLEILHTPGHSPGSICIYTHGHVFTGDTLFVGGIGRTDLPGSSLEALITSLKTKLFILPDDTIVWPGHNYGIAATSTLKREKQENPFVKMIFN